MIEKSKPVALWSGPRNVSTAMMYSFAQRNDTTVLDEPLFAYFLKQTGVWRPSRDEVLMVMESSVDRIFQSFRNFEDSPVLFLKNMANHMEGLEDEKLDNFKNIILIRDPRKVLSSYTKHIDTPTLMDIGYAYQIRILNYLKKQGLPVLVVDSDQVCIEPESELKRICEYLQIDFDPKMLSWEAGKRKEDGVWAKYWYHNVHKSTGFKKPEPREYKVAEHLTDLYEESLELYNEILKYR